MEGDADERRGRIVFGSIVFNSKGNFLFYRKNIYIYINTHRYIPLYSQALFTKRKAEKKKQHSSKQRAFLVHKLYS